MNTIRLHPYDSLRNPISVKLLGMSALFLVIGIAPTVVVLIMQGVSIALAGTGLWLLVLGLLAFYCYRLAKRIPGGFHELRRERGQLVCVSDQGEIKIQLVTISMVMLDKMIAGFVGYEIILLRDMNVSQLAVSGSAQDLQSVFDTLLIWLEAEEVPPNPTKKLPRTFTPGSRQDCMEEV